MVERIGLVLVLVVGSAAIAAQPPMARVAVRGGRFVDTGTGRVFRPRGVNYIRCRMLHKDGGECLWHDTFNPRSYSAERSEKALADIAANGLNVVRVFLDPEPIDGIVASPDATELSSRYMENLADFLRRARVHGVRALLCFAYSPGFELPKRFGGAATANVEGENLAFLDPAHIAAKAAYMADVAAEIKRRDPALLQAIFAYEIENEACFVLHKPPFSLKTGRVTFGGRTYDLGSVEDQQRLADDGIVATIDACVKAVRRVDRRALVGVSIFTYHAVGGTGPARMRTDATPDVRFPARPLAIARSAASYVDVHCYPTEATTVDKDLASIEFPALKAACARTGKPMIVGEVGTFKFAYPTLAQVVAAMNRDIRRLLGAGFAGFLYWTYDSTEQSDALWDAKSGSGEILDALAEMP